MNKLKVPLILIFFIFRLSVSSSQSIHIGLYGGTSTYIGDLSDKVLPDLKLIKGAFGVSVNYELFDQFIIRAGFTHAKVAGADSLGSKPNLKLRNLSFQSDIAEFSLTGEFYLFNLYDRHLSPYFFGGVAVFHFNPYAYTMAGQKVFLQPLSTEGQGLPGYSVKAYKLTQLAIPFGGGIKYAINDELRIGLEFGLRKLFTDHLDDLSTNYADANDLFNAKGALAVKMAYREDEVAGGNPFYPTKGTQRGGEKVKDYYYTFGFHLTYKLGGENSGSKNNRMGCPAVNY